MKLKQIELQGFKSFQSKSTFKIDSNLIGIVGPNGSGKSNIIDAVRWVLGEQSAKNLRGSNMQDVIFSGTEEKRAKNFAEVSITFSENEEDKVITRRLYKNGDSEYLLDGKKTKLKDITDVYFDLGINKESYSIITQGKVENILSSKPQDRRIIIEEAAGILKYKNKKKETNLKLEKTAENINRLNDIFTEIENRHNILSEQKEQTEKYLKYTEELTNKDILLKAYDIKNIEVKFKDCNEEKEKITKEKESLDKNIENISKEISNIKQQIYVLDNSYNNKKEEELQLSTECEKLNSLVQISKERLENKKNNLEKLEQSKINYKERETILLKKINDIKNECKLEKENLKEITKKSSAINKDSNEVLEQLDLEIEDLKDEYYKLITEESRLQNELVTINSLKETNSQNINNINKEIIALSNSLSENEQNIEDILKNICDLNDKQKKSSDKIERLEKEKINVANNHNKLIEKISQGNNLLKNLISKKEFLENQNNSFNYYNLGVKEILSNKDKIPGIHTSVGDILTFDTEYLTALDIALSSSQQNIIVDNSEVARKCVEHLKSKNKGRATFLPLSNISEKNVDIATLNILKSEVGFINLASKLVSYEDKYKNIVSHLLGLVIVVDNLKNGNNIAKSINFKYRIVTLDGQVINSGGSITGGAIHKNNNSIIKNKAELEDLENNINKVNIKLNKLNDELLVVEKEHLSLKNELEKEHSNLQNIIFDSKEQTMKKSILEENIAKIKFDIENENSKLSQFPEELSILEKENLINSSLDNIKKQLVEKDNLLSQKNNDRKLAKTDYEQYLLDINTLDVEKSKILESIKYKEKNITQLEEDMEYLTINYNKLLVEENELLNDDNNSVEKIDEYEKNILSYKQKLENLKQIISNIISEKEKLYNDENNLSLKLKEENNYLQNINEKLEKINVDIARYEIKIDDVVNYLLNTYNTTYEKIAPKLEDVTVLELNEYKKDVSILKKQLSSLGNVNMNAIEEFEEVDSRYNFYKTEIDDLVIAKKHLQETIKEIDKEVKARFLNTFNKVANNFDRIYKALFNGGTAQITLEDENDILNTGINIEASPPGKKLQKLSLLSGGEKALTAISLLFSILEIKDSPFVILDEVEAALDDVNVTRFAKFLKHYSLSNQFLVITHRRGTMQEMDKLYGVTMKEKGVSYILPLELDKILQEEYIDE